MNREMMETLRMLWDQMRPELRKAWNNDFDTFVLCEGKLP